VKNTAQDTYTACIYAALLAFVMIPAVLANTVQQQSGDSQSGMTRVSIDEGTIEVPAMGLTVQGNGGMSECNVSYLLVSQDSGTLFTFNEKEWEEDLADLHYAVYTCIERFPTIDDFI